MAQTFKDTRILRLLLLIGTVCAISLCFIRIRLEAENNRVAFVIEQSDLELMSSAHDMTADAYKEILMGAGLCDVISPESADNCLGVFFYPEEGGVYDNSGAIVGLNEDIKQFSFIPLEGFTLDKSVPMVRVLRLYRYMGNRYGVLGYDGSEEIENIIFRAITDRNIRIVWLTPFYNGQDLISDPYEYTTVLENTARRIASHGLHIENSVYAFPPDYSPSRLLVLGVLMGIVSGAILLLTSIACLGKRIKVVLLTLGCIGAFAIFVLNESIAITLGALAGSIVFPCLSLWLFALMLKSYPHDNSTRAAVLRFIKILLTSIAVSMVGGIFVSALQSSTRFLLAIDNFKGVKLSQVIPIAYAAYIFPVTLYGGRGLKGVFREMLSGRKLIIIGCAAALLAAAVLFILRTGDGMIAVSSLEQRIRNILEHTLLVRPRTKEFLVAWPCIGISTVFMARCNRQYVWPFTIMSAPGISSVINTFCHSRSPLWLSAARTGIGALFGFFIGLIAVLLLCAVIKKTPEASSLSESLTEPEMAGSVKKS